MSLFTIRKMPDELHHRLKVISLYEDKTMNEVVISAIEKHVQELELKHFGGEKKNVARSKTDK